MKKCENCKYAENVERLFEMIAKKGVKYCLLRLKAVKAVQDAKKEKVKTVCRLGTVIDLLGIQKSQVYRLTQAGRLQKHCTGKWYLDSVLSELRRREQLRGAEYGD